MSHAVAVLRPEPGNAATAARAEALGVAVIRLPLFAVRAIDWTPPDPAGFDALLLTSANAVRHGGAQLDRFRTLPVLAVGENSAGAARAAGFDVMATGAADAAALLALAEMRGIRRALHLTGRDRTNLPDGPVADTITVYASEMLDIAPESIATLTGSVALLHSARAARRLGALVTDRSRIRLAALSPAVLDAAGPGWEIGLAAHTPNDDALLKAALTLTD